MSSDTASLSGACARFLGRPLNKHEQISDWDQRPLSAAQQHYASLDAHCMLGIVDAILKELGPTPVCANSVGDTASVGDTNYATTGMITLGIVDKYYPRDTQRSSETLP